MMTPGVSENIPLKVYEIQIKDKKDIPNSKNNIDNIPIAPLKNYDCDLIIVVGLSNKDRLNKEGFDKNKIIEIYRIS